MLRLKVIEDNPHEELASLTSLAPPQFSSPEATVMSPFLVLTVSRQRSEALSFERHFYMFSLSGS